MRIFDKDNKINSSKVTNNLVDKTVSFLSNAWNKVGSNSLFGDFGVDGCLSIKSQIVGKWTGISFISEDEKKKATMVFDSANNQINVTSSVYTDRLKSKVLSADDGACISSTKMLFGNFDWNKAIDYNQYKIQGAKMTNEYHAPKGIYEYGILLVFKNAIGSVYDNSELRITQFYIPHGKKGTSAECNLCWRVYNGNSSHTPDESNRWTPMVLFNWNCN